MCLGGSADSDAAEVVDPGNQLTEKYIAIEEKEISALGTEISFFTAKFFLGPGVQFLFEFFVE